MKRRRRAGRGGGGGGKPKIQKEDEGEIIDILLNLPKVVEQSEFVSKYTFTWGRKKKRSVLVSKSKSKLSPSSHSKIDESRPEKSTAAEADASPSTPVSLLPSGSGNDDAADNPTQQSSSKKTSKIKATEDLMRRYIEMQREFFVRRKTQATENRKLRKIKRQKIRAMDALHQKRRAKNLELEAIRLELKSKRQEINKKKTVAPPPPPLPPPPPPPPPQQQLHKHCQNFLVNPNNGKVVAITCSSNSNSDGRFGSVNIHFVKTNCDQHYHRHITRSAPPPPPPPPPSSPPPPPPEPSQPLQQHSQQSIVDPNQGKEVAVTGSSNSNHNRDRGVRFGSIDVVDPRGKIHFIKVNRYQQHSHRSTPPPPTPPPQQQLQQPCEKDFVNPNTCSSNNGGESDSVNLVDPHGKINFVQTNRYRLQYHRRKTRLAPPPPPQPQQQLQHNCQQKVVDPNNDKVEAMMTRSGKRLTRSAPPPPPPPPSPAPPQEQLQQHSQQKTVDLNNDKVEAKTCTSNRTVDSTTVAATSAPPPPPPPPPPPQPLGGSVWSQQGMTMPHVPITWGGVPTLPPPTMTCFSYFPSLRPPPSGTDMPPNHEYLRYQAGGGTVFHPVPMHHTFLIPMPYPSHCQHSMPSSQTLDQSQNSSEARQRRIMKKKEKKKKRENKNKSHDPNDGNVEAPPPPPPPPPPQQQQQLQQPMVDSNDGNVEVMTCSSNPPPLLSRPPPPPPVLPPPLPVDHELRVRTAAEARKSRLMKMKGKSTLCHHDHDPKVKAAEARKYRIMRLKEKRNKNTSFHNDMDKRNAEKARNRIIMRLKEKNKKKFKKKKKKKSSLLDDIRPDVDDNNPDDISFSDARKRRIMKMKENKKSVLLSRANMKAAQDIKDLQRNFQNLIKKPFDLKIGAQVMLKVSPWKGVMRFGKRGKMRLRYIGPLKVLKTVGSQFFKLELPLELKGIHDTFHKSYLKKYCGKDDRVIPLTDLKVEAPNKVYEEPEAFIEAKTHKLKNKEIELVLVKWKHTHGRNQTWETMEVMKNRYPNFVDYDAIPRAESS